MKPDLDPHAAREAGGSRGWRIWIDTGGTFTDALAVDTDGRLRRAKVLTSGALRGRARRRVGAKRLEVEESWGVPAGFVDGFPFRLLDLPDVGARVVHYDPVAATVDVSRELPPVEKGQAFEVVSPEEAPILAARILTGTPAADPLPEVAMRLATTLATNALLERRGVPVALFVTRGFGDLLAIGTQQRPDLFSLEIRKPGPYHAATVEVPERLAADGRVLEPVTREVVTDRARRLVREGIRTAAVALLHSYRNPDHEREVRDLLLECGFRHVSCSCELAPFIHALNRAQTAVVDACLAPVIRGYLDRVLSSLSGGRLHVMTSAGGLVSPSSYRPFESLLSGPAGGVVGAAEAGRRSGFGRVIAFDMGGTSTDVARFDGDFEYVFEHRVGDARLVAPALSIESVAAGGGSVCWFDGQRLRVGPRSAGARPGPACYGAGGPLTLTDVNLLAGRLDPGSMGIPIDEGLARRALEAVCRRVGRSTGAPLEHDSALDGFLDIADERMADAIRRVSLRRGYDPSGYALVAFGGAGGQHACAVARRLGIRKIVVPADAGLLSALGLGHAAVERFAQRQVLRPLDSVESVIEGWMSELGEEALRAVALEGEDPASTRVRRRIARLRFVGQDAALEVEYEPGRPLRRSFERRYRQLFGHDPGQRPVELESIRVVASAAAAAETAEAARPAAGPPEPQATRKSRSHGRWTDTPTFRRDRLAPATRIEGPAIVFERHSATVIEPGWSAEVDGAGALLLRPNRDETVAPEDDRHSETVRLELFVNRFRSIAQEMGERLRFTAVSTNVKERLDFSCALLDPDGYLVVNAPHIPVHLGALGLCVRRLRESISMEPGDVVVTNHPAYGGSHLPDVTVVTPVHATTRDGEADGRGPGLLLGYVASRAHHAEIGGTRPGSMPPAGRRLAEEGVVIPPTHVRRRGVTCWDGVRGLLENAPSPTRALEDNLADLGAAVAANHSGAEALRTLASRHGTTAVLRYMKALEGLAETRIREALARMPDGRYEALETLDDGSPLRVCIEVSGGEAHLDFTGSASVHPGNLNATPAIVRSAVIYVLRLLVREPLPLNEGLMAAVSLRLPAGILNPPFPEDPAKAPAVVGGNVETSQRLVDTLLKALGIQACSQGTMNNVLFGNDRVSYYETVCGGCGAGPGYPGASAVHSHMTNTRITDPEVLEHRYPVRVERFAVRRGSGGEGRFRGGDGVVRELTFLEPMDLSLLTQHRTVAPYGVDGGAPGRPGTQRVLRAGGGILELASIDGCRVESGDRLVLETPGAGGYGTPDSSPSNGSGQKDHSAPSE